MKNIQVIDGANNCTYSIYAVSDADFLELFPNGQDIEFIEDAIKRLGKKRAAEILKSAWDSRQDKPSIQGLHGTLFYKSLGRKIFTPNKRESDYDDSEIQKRIIGVAGKRGLK